MAANLVMQARSGGGLAWISTLKGLSGVEK